tara:strand:- start:226 stop:432 length:207 start_codon:yes stop_codon:yes gene_type:complete
MFLVFCRQKVVKTQKTRRSVSRTGELPNLSILSFLLVRGKRKAAARQIRRFSIGFIHFVHRFLTEVMS